MNRLCTFVQISDLHFGSALAGKRVDPWARHVPLLKGFVGHDPATLVHVQRKLHSLRQSEPNVRLIVTGDLTAYGAAAQFAEAAAYLGGRGALPRFVGLDERGWQTWSIPGNHDQWPGVPFFSLGGPNSTVSTIFPTTAVGPWQPLGQGRTIEFLRLDSDADVDPWSPARFYACGSFVSALKDLAAKMTPPDPTRVRVLMLHHSFEHQGLRVGPTSWCPIAMSLHHLTIDDPSRQALTAFVRDHDIRVLLTGHVHEPHFLGTPPALNAARGRPVLEVRCGSTSQRLASGGQPSSDPRIKNTLMVHRLMEDPATGAVSWESTVEGYEFGVGFTPLAALPGGPTVRFSLPL